MIYQDPEVPGDICQRLSQGPLFDSHTGADNRHSTNGIQHSTSHGQEQPTHTNCWHLDNRCRHLRYTACFASELTPRFFALHLELNRRPPVNARM